MTDWLIAFGLMMLAGIILTAILTACNIYFDRKFIERHK